jgi:hypothetical protein
MADGRLEAHGHSAHDFAILSETATPDQVSGLSPGGAPVEQFWDVFGMMKPPVSKLQGAVGDPG